MSDNEKETKIETKTETEGGATSAQNADWEVVSLTASAYAASPAQPDKSGHFVFPPSEHENLPIQPPKEELEEETQEEQEDQENQETETEIPHQEEEEEEELIQNEERVVKSESEKSEEREKEGIEWVKKRVSCFYKHVKEANAYWSVFVAATLVGLVILGHRWQREKSHSSYQIKSGTNTARG